MLISPRSRKGTANQARKEMNYVMFTLFRIPLQVIEYVIYLIIIACN